MWKAEIFICDICLIEFVELFLQLEEYIFTLFFYDSLNEYLNVIKSCRKKENAFTELYSVELIPLLLKSLIIVI